MRVLQQRGEEGTGAFFRKLLSGFGHRFLDMAVTGRKQQNEFQLISAWENRGRRVIIATWMDGSAEVFVPISDSMDANAVACSIKTYSDGGVVNIVPRPLQPKLV